VIRTTVVIVFSCLYWALALILSGLAVVAPCGLAPGEWCELEGPSGFGSVLAALGPAGVLLAAGVIYVGAMWLHVHLRKVR
jgi:hypothetical protein